MPILFTPQAPLVIYRNEIIEAFNRREKLLYNTVTTQFLANGYQAVFQVADANPTLPVGRGANGMIPSTRVSQEQLTATMQIKFAKEAVNKEDVLGSQGDLEKLMSDSIIGQLNRGADQLIIDTLDTATNTAYSANPLTDISIDLFTALIAKLAQARVPNDGDIYCVIQPSVLSQLYKLPSFTNTLQVNNRTIPDATGSWKDMPAMYKWLGINFIVQEGLPGSGTASETNYIYHKKSIGLASSATGEGNFDMNAGYNGENSFFWANADYYMGSTIIQDTGIYKFYTNGTALVNLPA